MVLGEVLGAELFFQTFVDTAGLSESAISMRDGRDVIVLRSVSLQHETVPVFLLAKGNSESRPANFLIIFNIL